MEVIVEENFYKKVKKMPKNIQKRALEVLRLLENFPFVRIDIKKLKGKERLFRVRIGRYRILFILADNKIYVSDIDIRSKVEY
ncbi:MAG: type II toxin-antitoxin system RelE/ParE family toxin [Candidatus Aenigmarchaeota archaeon]|nr:type II toxin-antitoxin system RelE/ParE family toxin [Candidatus Aenigmarchaeota archaeon]